ncbi:MAG: c-type cytochrome [Steroidobacteraceae bacterium]|jgi:uncharacterized membrane protein
MINSFYDFLDKIGYLHPIHPAMVHMPIGLIVGSLFIGGAGLVFSRASMSRAAYYALVLALIFWVPTVTFGVMDWQRYYGGAWLFAIKMKVGLAGILGVLLVVGAWLGHRDPTRVKRLVPIYLLCFLTVSSLGYFGGQLVYGGKTPIGTTQFQSGQKLFENHCSGCHAHGGNSIMSHFPLRDAPELDKFEDFLTFIREPKLPGGVDGPMPPFAQSTISAEEAREVYDYITQVMDKPQRK